MPEDITHPVKLELPTVPNCIRIQDGDGTLPLQELSDETLRQLGRRWTEELIGKARARRSARAATGAPTRA